MLTSLITIKVIDTYQTGMFDGTTADIHHTQGLVVLR